MKVPDVKKIYQEFVGADGIGPISRVPQNFLCPDVKVRIG